MKFIGTHLCYTVLFTAFAYWLLTSFICADYLVENNAPQVTIISPAPNARFSWNSVVNYSIKVADKEDGLSEYEEINAKEVLLEVRYLPNAAFAKKYLDQKKNEKEHTGLTMIKRSDCFTCHASKSKLIGPSFELIAKKYKLNEINSNRIAKNIINGSKGLWGNEAMPAHQLLKANEVKQMVNWILQNGANPNLLFYPGIEGAFRTKEKPAKGAAKTVMVLTASYTDHGGKEKAQDKKYGQHSIIVQAAN